MSHTYQLHSIPGPLHLLVPLFRMFSPRSFLCPQLKCHQSHPCCNSLPNYIVLFPDGTYNLNLYYYFFICVFPSNVSSKKAETLTSSLLHPCAQHIIADEQQITGTNERTVSRRVIVRMHPYLILKVLENLFCYSVK